MKAYTGDKIRNVAIVGHGGAGTTSVTEALLYRAGAIDRMCKVEDGATTTDYEPEEIKRGVSVNATLAPVEWRDSKINFIDTPGFADFVAEVKGAFRAVDSALIVINATAGVQVGTEQCWKLAEEAGLPRILLVNKMDRENADFDSILENLRHKFGKKVLPLELPLGKEDKFEGVIDCVKMKAYRKNGNGSDEIEIPDDLKAYAEDMHEKMVEAAVEADDECMMRYLEGETISDEEIKKCLIQGIRQAHIFPMICCSALKNIGLGRTMNAIIDYTYPAILNDYKVKDVATGEEVTRDAGAPMAALVFKTTSDPFVGRLSFIRVFSGSIKADSMVYNSSREKDERIANVFTMRGKSQIAMKEITAGDIGVTSKLQFTVTGDTLSDKANPVLFAPIAFPLPMYTVEADLRAPQVEYRETIRGKAHVQGKHKKQSGGHGQYGDVVIDMEPLPPGSGFEFVDKIFGGAVPRQYIPAVEKGMQDCMQHGILAGYPVVDVRITLVDGSYHPVDSSEMAFKTASSIAFKKAMEEAKPVLMEPYYNLYVLCAESMMGDVIGDLNSKRGRILGMQSVEEGISRVEAQVPYAEIMEYSVDLRALTQGMGTFEMKFDHYEDVPAKMAEKIIEERKKEAE